MYIGSAASTVATKPSAPIPATAVAGNMRPHNVGPQNAIALQATSTVP